MKPTTVRANTAQSWAVTGAILVLLLGIAAGASRLPRRGFGRWLNHAVAQARSLDVRRHQTNGYYESLLNAKRTRDGRMLLAIVRGNRPEQEFEPYLRDRGYLRYEYKPFVNGYDADEGPVSTNSHGLADREYSIQKPPGTRRIALFGDSIPRGWGVLPVQRFETLIENRLDSDAPRFEVLNFSVPGYVLTQIVEVVREKAPPFRPDTYMVVLTELSVDPTWSDHLRELVRTGSDLKHQFLREVVRKSGVRPEDDMDVFRAKIAPYRFSLMRELLLEMKKVADRDSASFVVVVVPAAEDTEIIRRRFAGAREAISGIGITLDLLDTFEGAEDVETLRVQWYDAHPNPKGHWFLAGNLHSKIRQESIWPALTRRP